MPSRLVTLSQKKARELETVELLTQNATEVETPIPEIGVRTVQFVSPGEQLGFKVSPGL